MSVTTVPIPPAKKSTLIKYWVGIALLLAVGAALAFVGTDAVRTKYQGNDEFFANNKAKKGVVTTATGLQYQVLTAGKGALPWSATRAHSAMAKCSMKIHKPRCPWLASFRDFQRH
jgi:FKBP-type peptidyl-prolyl cis-trans isomerase FkpA